MEFGFARQERGRSTILQGKGLNGVNEMTTDAGFRSLGKGSGHRPTPGATDRPVDLIDASGHSRHMPSGPRCTASSSHPDSRRSAAVEHT